MPTNMMRNGARLARSYADRLTVRRVSRKIGSHAGRLRALGLTLMPGEKRYRCNACERQHAGFHYFGEYTLLCPLCGSRDRERFLISNLNQGNLSLPKHPRMLHIAPNEIGLSRRLAEAGELVKGDLEPARYGRGTIKVDLMDMSGLHDFDLVVLSHVLEHVPDDHHVLRQVWSSLAPGGQVWIMVPMIYPETREADPSTSLRDRDLHFGGSDHVRGYGPDIVERTAEAGFDVRALKTNGLPEQVANSQGLLPDVVFVATRSERSAGPLQQT